MVTCGAGLRWDVGLGVRELEAGFLPGKASFRKIFGALLRTAEHRGSELHLPAISHREVAAWMD